MRTFDILRTGRLPDGLPLQGESLYALQGGYVMPSDGIYGEVIGEVQNAAREIEPTVTFMDTKASVRYQGPDAREKALPWHQDVHPMRLDPGQRGLVAWVPLDDIDGTRPALELGATVPMQEHRATERYFAEAQYPARGEPVHDMEAGDVLFFSPFQLHRTHFPSGCTNGRYSLDLRFAA